MNEETIRQEASDRRVVEMEAFEVDRAREEMISQ